MGNPTQETKQYPIALALTVRDPKKTIAFFTEKLGFTQKETWPDRENPMWANLVLDGQSVMLGGLCDPEAAAKMCGDNEGAVKYMTTLYEEFQGNKRGVGSMLYIEVPDIDAYYKTLKKNGVTQMSPPKSQFYGIREVALQEPTEGYRFMFYTTIRMESCQSCGMPLTDAKPGEMYCHYCAGEDGQLKPYEIILEGTIQGYFMNMKKMPRKEAESAAKEHLAKMPAWAGRN